MHISVGILMEVNATLSRALQGRDPYTGAMNEPIKELPTGIFRHLRRFHNAVKGELEIVLPEHKAFVEKWAADGKFPDKDAENFAEFIPAYNEFFGTPDIVLPFSTPFQLDLIKPETVVPLDIMNLMENVNDTIADELKKKAIPPATAVSDSGALTPIPNA